MKKFIVLATLLIGAGSVCAQPEGDQFNIDPECPPTIEINTVPSDYGKPATMTENRSNGYDARTTVTDNMGNQSTYTTPAQSATLQRGGQIDRNSQGYTNQSGPNSNVSKVEVDCAPTGL